MRYIKVVFSEMPRIVFAHHYHTEPSRWMLNMDPRLVEITYCQAGSIFREVDGKAVFYPPQAVACYLHDAPARAWCEEEHRHFTVAFSAGAQVEYIGADRVWKTQPAADGQAGVFTVILPELLPPGAAASDISRELEAIVRHMAAGMPYSRLEATQRLLAALSRLTRWSVEQAGYGAANAAVSPYSRRAVEYMAEHLHEPMTVGELAEELQISYEHLSRLFKRDFGMSLIEYRNRMKLERIKELLLTKNITLAQAGESVGIEDEKYLSRLFRKYTGMTATAYRRAHKVYENDQNGALLK
ncbi:MAG: helix-turn-helix transcriptional regulator [Clostridia bacterium]|nr:helix-turn-helix transcriptional regulator [Clostridia bacterium]